jgi:hypothetical protein
VLLPTHLIKFQVTRVVPQPALRIEQQNRSNDDQQAVSRNVGAVAEPEKDDALAHQEAQEQHAIVDLVTSLPVTTTGLGDEIVTFDSEGQGGDELDKIVAEGQETADLVILFSLKRCLITLLTLFKPLDSHDENFEQCSYTTASDSEDCHAPKRQAKKRKTSRDAQCHFSCMRKMMA